MQTLSPNKRPTIYSTWQLLMSTAFHFQISSPFPGALVPAAPGHWPSPRDMQLHLMDVLSMRGFGCPRIIMDGALLADILFARVRIACSSVYYNNKNKLYHLKIMANSKIKIFIALINCTVIWRLYTNTRVLMKLT